MTRKMKVGSYICLLDKDGFELASKFKWSINRGGYVNRQFGRTKHKLLHRWLVNAPAGMVVDHINGNPLDNRRSNLRICSNAENSRNRKINRNNKYGAKGVDVHRGKWRAQITLNRKLIHLGYFSNKLDAVRAYSKAALFYHGDFVRGARLEVSL